MPQSTLPKLHIKVIAPTQTIFSGQADSISSTNMHGAFDILPLHIHYVSLIEQFLMINDEEKKTEIKFKKGIIHCLNDQVQVYLTDT